MKPTKQKTPNKLIVTPQPPTGQAMTLSPSPPDEDILVNLDGLEPMHHTSAEDDLVKSQFL